MLPMTASSIVASRAPDVAPIVLSRVATACASARLRTAATCTNWPPAADSPVEAVVDGLGRLTVRVALALRTTVLSAHPAVAGLALLDQAETSGDRPDPAPWVCRPPESPAETDVAN